MDAITLLKDDHKVVEQLFKRFEKAGEHAYTEKREIVDRIVEELAKHAAIEEQLFYPVVRATVPDTEDITLESLEEHHIVKWVLDEVDGMDPRAERFDAKVTVLIENVRHHVEEEEQELFPKVRKELGRKVLADLGEAMATAKKSAPTHPHPRAPDTPPGNLMAGTSAGMVDRIGDTVSGIAQGSVTAAGDIIAMVLHRKRPSVSPKGTTVARSTAENVRAEATSVTEHAIEAVTDAKRSAEEAGTKAVRKTRATVAAATVGTADTVRTARSGATSTGRAAKAGTKATATSARTAARRTTATAKTTTAKKATAKKKTATAAKKKTATAAKSGA